VFLYSSCINIGVDRAGKWWVPAIPDHERQASVPCVRLVSRGTVFYLDGSPHGQRECAGLVRYPDGLGGGGLPRLGQTAHSLIESRSAGAAAASDVGVHY